MIAKRATLFACWEAFQNCISQLRSFAIVDAVCKWFQLRTFTPLCERCVPSVRRKSWRRFIAHPLFEADGVSPVYCGPNGREQALSYARQRSGYGRAEIQVLDESGNVAETISNEDSRPLV